MQNYGINPMIVHDEPVNRMMRLMAADSANSTLMTCDPVKTFCDPPIDNRTGRLLISITFFLFGASGLLLNILVAMAMYRAGMLGKGPRSSPIFIIVATTIADGIIRNSYYGIYGAASALAHSTVWR